MESGLQYFVELWSRTSTDSAPRWIDGLKSTDLAGLRHQQPSLIITKHHKPSLTTNNHQPSLEDGVFKEGSHQSWHVPCQTTWDWHQRVHLEWGAGGALGCFRTVLWIVNAVSQQPAVYLGKVYAAPLLAPQFSAGCLASTLGVWSFSRRSTCGQHFCHGWWEASCSTFVEIDGRWSMIDGHPAWQHAFFMQDSVRWLWQCCEHLGESTRCAGSTKNQRGKAFSQKAVGPEWIVMQGIERCLDMSGCTMQSLIHIL